MVDRAEVNGFLRKWMRDMRDAQLLNGGFPIVAPMGDDDRRPEDLDFGRPIGWSDAGVNVPHVVWSQTGDRSIVDENIAAHGGCLQTGFLGTSVLMDTETEHLGAKAAYDLLFQRKEPSWLFTIDNGATTMWERWNSYTKKDGFGKAGMNSFNHYAYGAVLGWLYKTAAGIASDPNDPGFRTVVMRPQPDRRLGFVKAEYKSAAGLVKSAWRYEGEKWIWEFEVPEGAKVRVTVPGQDSPVEYPSGAHRIETPLATAAR